MVNDGMVNALCAKWLMVNEVLWCFEALRASSAALRAKLH